MPTPVRENLFAEAIENDVGWCTHCKRFTGEEVEPDTDKAWCPECGHNTVVSAEIARIRREISIS